MCNDVTQQFTFHIFCLAFIFARADTSMNVDARSPLTAKWQDIQNQWKKLGEGESRQQEPLGKAAEIELERESVSFFEQWDQVFKQQSCQKSSPEQEWLAIQDGWAQLVQAIEKNETKSEETSRMERQLRRRMRQCWNARTKNGVLAPFGQGGISSFQPIGPPMGSSITPTPPLTGHHFPKGIETAAVLHVILCACRAMPLARPLR